MSNSISWVLQLSIHPGQHATAEALVAEMVEATRAAEPGTIIYEFFMSADGETCHIYERYTDNDAAMVHLGNFGSKYAQRFMACFQPSSFTVYGPVNDQVRGVLDGFGANYLAAAAGFAR